MKPPPRKRTKRYANIQTQEEEQCHKQISSWRRGEQRSLLNGLKALARTDGGQSDLDYAALKQYVPTRSTTEIESVIDTLKDKLITSVCREFEKKRRDDNKVSKPIEKWTHMASVVGGALDEPINTAFSQMLIVSSTEPCTLRNSDPPQMDKPLVDQNSPLGRIVPFRPMHHTPNQGEPPGISAVHPLPILKPPAPTLHPAKRLLVPSKVASTTTAPPPKQQSPEAVGNPPLASITSCQTSASVSASTHGHTQTTPQHKTTIVCSAAATPVPSTSDSSLSLPLGAASSSVPAHTTPKFGPTGKYTTKYHPVSLGVKSIVNFEKIYQFLSVINNPDQGCKLTPMESAIVLDLLMSLPEELPLLDCKNLQKHLIQVYQALSVPADSKMIKELFKGLKGAGESECHTAGSQDGPHDQSTRASEANPQQDDRSWCTKDTGPKAPQPQETDSQSSGNTNTNSQCEDEDMMGLCPPLNPFMVPLELLKRKSSAQ
ncbi:snRNA-activating protein complex subunit 2 isoform X2 [Sphaeramia orbicularis]|uniref:snRNA-activating protein complex subunit 2 isoform X2 n=1 Tax=Sphaeramia orbicularis TaxID=375764 RepID=UPI00117E5094|nr:snRNA-activating protein complex subunit 2 isoform X2 [Sphaeramia orbicularis]